MEKLFKKISIPTIAMLLLLSFSFAFSQPALAPPPPTPLGTMVVDRMAEPVSVDPHWAYDTASEELIFNVYDTLIFFNRELIPQSGQYELHVADSYTISPDGLTYRFLIRAGIPWHNAAFGVVTPSDVEYSFERALIMGAEPTWMLGEPLLGTMFATDFGAITDPYSGVALSTLNLIRNSVVETDAAGAPTPGGGYIQFNLQMPYASFGQVLSHTVSSILSKSWTAQFTWSGAYDVDGDDQVNGIDPFGDGDVDEFDAATIFTEYNSPSVSPLDSPTNVMMGCGPYTFATWTVGTSWTITQFANYYLGWPAAGASSFVTTVQVNYVPSWATRLLRFDDCISDITDILTVHYPAVVLNPNIRGTKDLPSLTADALFFNFNVPSYAPFQPRLGGVINGTLMSDWHMRKAFQYSLMYAAYIVAIGDEAVQPANPANPIIAGLPFYDPTDTTPGFAPALAQWHFMLAWGGSDVDGSPATMNDVTPGQAWTQGFTLPITYNAGNLNRQIAAQMWETMIEGYPFVGAVDIIPTPVASAAYIPLLETNQLPTFMLGWQAAFTDPHSFVLPFMHPNGYFAGNQNVAYGGSGHITKNWAYLPGPQPAVLTMPPMGITNNYVAALIEEGMKQSADVDRNAIYRELANIYFDEAPSIMTAQQLVRHWEKKWVQGWYFNSLYPGLYFYHLWKGLDADMSGNGAVYIDDIAVLNAYWWDGCVAGSVAAYNRKADINWPGRNFVPIDYPPPGPNTTDRKADTTEMDGVYYLTGVTSSPTDNCWEAFGIPARGDGFVDIFDAAMINAQWLDP